MCHLVPVLVSLRVLVRVTDLVGDKVAGTVGQLGVTVLLVVQLGVEPV